MFRRSRFSQWLTALVFTWAGCIPGEELQSESIYFPTADKHFSLGSFHIHFDSYDPIEWVQESVAMGMLFALLKNLPGHIFLIGRTHQVTGLELLAPILYHLIKDGLTLYSAYSLKNWLENMGTDLWYLLNPLGLKQPFEFLHESALPSSGTSTFPFVPGRLQSRVSPAGHYHLYFPRHMIHPEGYFTLVTSLPELVKVPKLLPALSYTAEVASKMHPGGIGKPLVNKLAKYHLYKSLLKLLGANKAYSPGGIIPAYSRNLAEHSLVPLVPRQASETGGKTGLMMNIPGGGQQGGIGSATNGGRRQGISTGKGGNLHGQGNNGEKPPPGDRDKKASSATDVVATQENIFMARVREQSEAKTHNGHVPSSLWIRERTSLLGELATMYQQGVHGVNHKMILEALDRSSVRIFGFQVPKTGSSLVDFKLPELSVHGLTKRIEGVINYHNEKIKCTNPNAKLKTHAIKPGTSRKVDQKRVYDFLAIAAEQGSLEAYYLFIDEKISEYFQLKGLWKKNEQLEREVYDEIKFYWHHFKARLNEVQAATVPQASPQYVVNRPVLASVPQVQARYVMNPFPMARVSPAFQPVPPAFQPRLIVIPPSHVSLPRGPLTVLPPAPIMTVPPPRQPVVPTQAQAASPVIPTTRTMSPEPVTSPSCTPLPGENTYTLEQLEKFQQPSSELTLTDVLVGQASQPWRVGVVELITQFNQQKAPGGKVILTGGKATWWYAKKYGAIDSVAQVNQGWPAPKNEKNPEDWDFQVQSPGVADELIERVETFAKAKSKEEKPLHVMVIDNQQVMKKSVKISYGQGGEKESQRIDLFYQTQDSQWAYRDSEELPVIEPGILEEQLIEVIKNAEANNERERAAQLTVRLDLIKKAQEAMPDDSQVSPTESPVILSPPSSTSEPEPEQELLPANPLERSPSPVIFHASPKQEISLPEDVDEPSHPETPEASEASRRISTASPPSEGEESSGTVESVKTADNEKESVADVTSNLWESFLPGLPRRIPGIVKALPAEATPGGTETTPSSNTIAAPIEVIKEKRNSKDVCTASTVFTPIREHRKVGVKANGKDGKKQRSFSGRGQHKQKKEGKAERYRTEKKEVNKDSEEQVQKPVSQWPSLSELEEYQAPKDTPPTALMVLPGENQAPEEQQLLDEDSNRIPVGAVSSELAQELPGGTEEPKDKQEICEDGSFEKQEDSIEVEIEETTLGQSEATSENNGPERKPGVRDKKTKNQLKKEKKLKRKGATGRKQKKKQELKKEQSQESFPVAIPTLTPPPIVPEVSLAETVLTWSTGQEECPVDNQPEVASPVLLVEEEADQQTEPAAVSRSPSPVVKSKPYMLTNWYQSLRRSDDRFPLGEASISHIAYFSRQGCHSNSECQLGSFLASVQAGLEKDNDMLHITIDRLALEEHGSLLAEAGDTIPDMAYLKARLLPWGTNSLELYTRLFAARYFHQARPFLFTILLDSNSIFFNPYLLQGLREELGSVEYPQYRQYVIRGASSWPVLDEAHDTKKILTLMDMQGEVRVSALKKIKTTMFKKIAKGAYPGGIIGFLHSQNELTDKEKVKLIRYHETIENTPVSQWLLSRLLDDLPEEKKKSKPITPIYYHHWLDRALKKEGVEKTTKYYQNAIDVLYAMLFEESTDEEKAVQYSEIIAIYHDKFYLQPNKLKNWLDETHSGFKPGEVSGNTLTLHNAMENDLKKTQLVNIRHQWQRFLMERMTEEELNEFPSRLSIALGLTRDEKYQTWLKFFLDIREKQLLNTMGEINKASAQPGLPGEESKASCSQGKQEHQKAGIKESMAIGIEDRAQQVYSMLDVIESLQKIQDYKKGKVIESTKGITGMKPLSNIQDLMVHEQALLPLGEASVDVGAMKNSNSEDLLVKTLKKLETQSGKSGETVYLTADARAVSGLPLGKNEPMIPELAYLKARLQPWDSVSAKFCLMLYQARYFHEAFPYLVQVMLDGNSPVFQPETLVAISGEVLRAGYPEFRRFLLQGAPFPFPDWPQVSPEAQTVTDLLKLPMQERSEKLSAIKTGVFESVLLSLSIGDVNPGWISVIHAMGGFTEEESDRIVHVLLGIAPTETNQVGWLISRMASKALSDTPAVQQYRQQYQRISPQHSLELALENPGSSDAPRLYQMAVEGLGKSKEEQVRLALLNHRVYQKPNTLMEVLSRLFQTNQQVGSVDGLDDLVASTMKAMEEELILTQQVNLNHEFLLLELAGSDHQAVSHFFTRLEALYLITRKKEYLDWLEKLAADPKYASYARAVLLYLQRNVLESSSPMDDVLELSQ